jgi:cyclopropane fatty-acyl-phospholipid synthase-like methyltransferase
LEQARRRGIAVELTNASLQELVYNTMFDAVLTVDAMDNVAPEAWPLVVTNLHRALKRGGLLFMTVENIAESDIATAFTLLRESDAPAVEGEIIEGDLSGYHYYPGREQVQAWFAANGLRVVEEAFKCEEAGWSYHHFLLRA